MVERLLSRLGMNARSALIIRSIQGLVMQSLFVGDVELIRGDVPGVFVIYRCGIGSDR
jgi:TetR/AcrR family transcriptional regulator